MSHLFQGPAEGTHLEAHYHIQQAIMMLIGIMDHHSKGWNQYYEWITKLNRLLHVLEELESEALLEDDFEKNTLAPPRL